MLDIEQLQEFYSRRTNKDHRRAHGQFFTPRWIASGMARWVIKAQPDVIVDPAFGMGMLLDECARQGFGGRLVGTEIDADLVDFWRSESQNSDRIELLCENFLRKDPGPLRGVVANPPYNRFQNRDIPAYVLQKMWEVVGESPSGYTKQYALFLYAVVSRLENGGRAAFIVPSEFLGTGYGVQVKRFLVKTQRLRHLVIFDTAERIFPDAATTACVLLFGECRQDSLTVWHLPGNSDQTTFQSVCDEQVPAHGSTLSIPYARLDVEANWQGLGLEQLDWCGFVELRTFGRVKRGIATGANEFFLLSHPAALGIGLSGTDLLPCVASADSIAGLLFSNTDWEDLRLHGKEVYLFDGVNARSDAAEVYIAMGERAEYHLRYLTKMRRPWYRLESRENSPLLLAVFGRSRFKAVLNSSNAVNLTAFHGFIPETGYKEVASLLWMYLQTPLARSAFLRQQRAYGDGLKKLEPGDWGKLLVPDWNLWTHDGLDIAHSIVEQGIDALHRNDNATWLRLIEKFQQLIDEYGSAFAAGIEKPVSMDQLMLL